jgi:quercetin dioxygenase-like cupin family protein
VASVVRMTDRMRRHPDAANVTVAEFIHLPVGVSIASLTLEPGAQVTIRKGDDDGEGLFVTHGTGWVAGGHGDREEVVAGNIVYHDRDPDLVVGTDVGMIVLRIRGGFMMPGRRV